MDWLLQVKSLVKTLKIKAFIVKPSSSRAQYSNVSLRKRIKLSDEAIKMKSI